MKKLNEKEIINIFQKKLKPGKFFPEDVEIFRTGNTLFVTKIDTMVESTDITPGMKLEDAIRKSVVACVSDFAAKGVKPRYGSVSVTIPKKFSKKKITSLANGLAKAAKEFNFKILGGDTNEGKEIVIQVSLFGVSKKIITRRGAKINDIIVSTGPFGYTAAGLQILLNQKKASKKFADKAKLAVLKPIPRLNFGLKNKDFFSSSMDSSDGLSPTLHELSRQSKKRFVITKLPTNSDVFEFAKINRINANELIFHGGEEYEFVGTVPPQKINQIKKNAQIQKIPLLEIGYVTKGKGVIFLQNNKSKKIQDKGWVHFES